MKISEPSTEVGESGNREKAQNYAEQRGSDLAALRQCRPSGFGLSKRYSKETIIKKNVNI